MDSCQSPNSQLSPSISFSSVDSRNNMQLHQMLISLLVLCLGVSFSLANELDSGYSNVSRQTTALIPEPSSCDGAAIKPIPHRD